MNEKNEDKRKNHEEPIEDQGLTWRQMIGSALAAILGVQSRRNRERDFTRGDIRKFIVLGVILTLLLLGALIGVVKLVISQVT